MVVSASKAPVGSSVLIGTRYSSLENVRKNVVLPPPPQKKTHTQKITVHYQLNLVQRQCSIVPIVTEIEPRGMELILFINVNVTIDTILNLYTAATV